MKALPKKHHLFIGTNLLLSLIFILTACASNAEGSTSSAPVHSTPTHNNPTPPTTAASGPSSNPTPIATAPILSGTQTCPSGFSSPSHWDTIVGTQNGTSRVESVSCATLIGLSILQALVTVRFDGTGALLNLYVYTNITSANPTKLFMLQGLYKGDAKISASNTIITGEVDEASSINNNQPNVSLVQDLFREFKWSTSTNTFVQTSFPGIFPDLTRFQAEKDQAMVNQGHEPWKLDPLQTARSLAVTLLKWSPSAQTTLLSGGGSQDIHATVSVQSTSPGRSTITVTLQRLEGNTNSGEGSVCRSGTQWSRHSERSGGIWEATEVEAGTIPTITTPTNAGILHSPVAVTGTGNAFEGKIGTVVVLDHLYTPIGQVDANGATGNGPTTFSTTVTYHSTFQGGAEEGVLALYIYSNADGSIATAIMLKELLNA